MSIALSDLILTTAHLCVFKIKFLSLYVLHCLARHIFLLYQEVRLRHICSDLYICGTFGITEFDDDKPIVLIILYYLRLIYLYLPFLTLTIHLVFNFPSNMNLLEIIINLDKIKNSYLKNSYSVIIAILKSLGFRFVLTIFRLI